MCRLTTTTDLVLFVYRVPIIVLILLRRMMQLPTPVVEFESLITPLYNGELPRAMATLGLRIVGSTALEFVLLALSGPGLSAFEGRLEELSPPVKLPSAPTRVSRLATLPRSRLIRLMCRLIRLVALEAIAVAWPMCMPAISRHLEKVMTRYIVKLLSYACWVVRSSARSVTTFFSAPNP